MMEIWTEQSAFGSVLSASQLLKELSKPFVKHATLYLVIAEVV